MKQIINNNISKTVIIMIAYAAIIYTLAYISYPFTNN